MDRHVPVALLEAVVFADVVQIIATNDDRPLHLELQDDRREDPTSDGDVPRERALLVDVRPLDRLRQFNDISITSHVIPLCEQSEKHRNHQSRPP